jgi:hypothetical protein
MDILIHPIAIYGSMLAGFALLMVLHVLAVRRLGALQREAEDRLGEIRRDLDRLRAEFTGALAERERAEAAAAVGTVASWPGTAAPMNVGKRTQALRMSRRGQAPERIAAALGITRREVELLLKVQKTMAGAA